MSLTFTSLTPAHRRPDARGNEQTGRPAEARTGRAGGDRLHRVLAGGARSAGLFNMEWTHVLRKTWPLRPLVFTRGSRHCTPGMARQARRVACLEAPPMGPPPFVGQRRLRRIPRGDAAQAR